MSGPLTTAKTGPPSAEADGQSRAGSSLPGSPGEKNGVTPGRFSGVTPKFQQAGEHSFSGKIPGLFEMETR